MVWRWPWAAEGWWWRLRDNVRKLEKWRALVHMHVDDWILCGNFWLVVVFFPTALTRSGGLLPGGPLRDAVWVPHHVNCQKGATTDIKAQLRSIWAMGLPWIIVRAWSDLTRLILLDGESHVILLLLSLQNKKNWSLTHKLRPTVATLVQRMNYLI